MQLDPCSPANVLLLAALSCAANPCSPSMVDRTHCTWHTQASEHLMEPEQRLLKGCWQYQAMQKHAYSLDENAFAADTPRQAPLQQLLQP